MDPSRIELEPHPCHGHVLPLYYGPLIHGKKKVYKSLGNTKKLNTSFLSKSMIYGVESWALLALRVILFSIMTYHAVLKLKKHRTPFPFKALGIIEGVAAVFILLGVATEVGSLVVSLIMIGAIITKRRKWKIPFSSETTTGWEFDLVILGAVIVLMAFGPGEIALDTFIANYQFY